MSASTQSTTVPATSSHHKHSPHVTKKPHKQPFWLGGLASMGAACCSHPLDLLKVRLQCTATVAPGGAVVPREGLIRLVGNIIRTDGILSLYNGLSASLLRQGTYSTVRFGCYESLKGWRLEQLRDQYHLQHSSSTIHTHASAQHKSSYPTDLPFLECVGFSMVSGSIGGVVGSPADLVNVRMQNDKKLPVSERRNYRNVFDGLYRIVRSDGVLSLWNGVGPNVARAALMTTGQLASYDVFKSGLVERGLNEKHIGTHLTASCLSGVVATVITQPVDVVKTRIMNASKSSAPLVAPPGGLAISSSVAPSTMQVVRSMLATEGPQAFFKGFVPALTRLGPHTVATFVFLEQLKKLTS